MHIQRISLFECSDSWFLETYFIGSQPQSYFEKLASKDRNGFCGAVTALHPPIVRNSKYHFWVVFYPFYTKITLVYFVFFMGYR